MILGERVALLGATRAGKYSAGIASVGTDNVRLRDQDDGGGAATELSDTLRSILHSSGTGERIGAAMFILDLLQASTAFRLVHHDIHKAEAFLEGVAVLLTLIFGQLNELGAELLSDVD